jgi:CRISPR-associated protein Cas1
MLDLKTVPDVPDLVPARMLNEFAYCPRLAYLEWAEGDFADSADTVEGRFHHRKVDKESGALPPADRLPEDATSDKLHARSIYLSAPKVGLVARIDLVEATGAVVTPVDYKRGEAPNVPERAWETPRQRGTMTSEYMEVAPSGKIMRVVANYNDARRDGRPYGGDL